jgi:hypothetical protein
MVRLLLEESQRIDEKAGIVLTSGTIVLPITAALVSDLDIGEVLSLRTALYLLVASVAYAGLFVCFLRGFRTRRWKTFPSPSFAYTEFRGKDLQVLHAWIIKGCQKGHQHNSKILRQKSEALRWSIYFLGFETLFLMLAALFLLLDV